MAMTEPNRLFLLFSSISLFVLFQSALAQNGTLRLSPGAQLHALLDLRSSLGLRSRDWPRKADPCSWVGVRCGGGGRVEEINVSGMRRTRDGTANPRFAVDALSNFTHLVSFNASGFSLPGSIPEWFGQRLTALQVLDLRSASVDGSIPASLGALGGLEALYLSANNLTGNIPSALGKLLQLSVLDLSMNFLTGAVPPDFAFLGNLTRLDLSGNFLSGSVPPGLGRLSTLESLNLSDNSLSGSVPGELGNASRLVELDLSKNSLSGSLPVELGGLGSLRKMVIGYNGLDGPLPGGLFLSLANLEVVVLSGNKLDGSLPDVLWSMPNLSFVDVSSNNFTGVLPSFGSYGNGSGGRFNLSNNLFYGALTTPLLGKFRFIDLSGNYLQGKILDDDRSNAALNQNCLQDVLNQKNLEDCRLFYAERGSSFDEFGVQEPAQSPSSPALNKSKRLTFILVGVFGGLGFIFLLVLALVLILRVCDKGNANQRSSANVGPVPEGGSSTLAKDPMFISDLGESYSYEQMLLSTGDFSEANLIKHGHSGDLYHGILEGGTPVVIKKVDLRFVKKDSHMVELEFFSKVSHTRLALLLGHCLEHENDKLLVYKYMPNGDLATSFYRVTNPEADGLQSLDWITRLKIATGAAEGLSYLHHECTPSIVHRDVQASSILLDDKFEVRLGSLSEVHTQGDTHQNVLTRLLWKPPTSDQGPSGSSTVTCAYDVYCFGKVLLELVTGKVGISRSDDSSTREWLEQTLPYISIYDKELITKIVDPLLVVDEDLLEEVWAMAVVAKSCLNPKPSRRPPMKYILKALENPWKVVREDSSHSARRSWSAAVFGSWRQNSSESSNVLGHASRDGLSGLRQPGRVGSQGSGGIEHSSSHKRLSNDIFPEPVDMQEIEREAR